MKKLKIQQINIVEIIKYQMNVMIVRTLKMIFKFWNNIDIYIFNLLFILTIMSKTNK